MVVKLFIDPQIGQEKFDKVINNHIVFKFERYS
jgi:hypothetical protein